jgi:PAS domain S-box-containing protein
MKLEFNNLSGQETGQYFLQLARALPDLIYLVDPIDFKVQFVNNLPAALKSEAIIGKSIFEFIPAEHIELYRGLFLEIEASGKPITLELESSHGLDGKTGKIWQSCSGSALKNVDGATVIFLLITKDITAIKLHDIEIQNKEEKLYAILNNTNDVILSIDREHRLTESNSVFRTMIEKGFGKTDLIGSSIFDYIDPKKHEHLKDIYHKVFLGEVANDIDRFDTISGQTVYNETSYHPIYNFRREITGISIFSKNITERVVNETKLKNTLKERELLLAEIHHRIKNNLALISSILLLKEMNIENETAKEALSDSRKRIKSTALVHEMLYKNDTFDRISLNEYLIELFNNLNVNPNISLELLGDNPIFELNRALPFGLMMHELMMNSFKHSFRERGEAKLKLESWIEGGKLVIEYCDCSGDFPAHVDFNDTSSTGLMLIHTFIEQLGGSIQLISRIPPRYLLQIPMA